MCIHRIKGKIYIYRHWRVGHKVMTQYMGPLEPIYGGPGRISGATVIETKGVERHYKTPYDKMDFDKVQDRTGGGSKSWISYPNEDVVRRYCYDPPVIEPISSGSILGLGILLHEKVEWDILDEFKSDRWKRVHEAHREAIDKEMRFYRSIAQERGKEFSLGTLNKVGVLFLLDNYPRHRGEKTHFGKRLTGREREAYDFYAWMDGTKWAKAVTDHLAPDFKSKEELKAALLAGRLPSHLVKRLPTLDADKEWQRIEAMKALPEHKTILELNAGRGYLSSHVYAGRAKRMILVDDDGRYLQAAKRKLEGKPLRAYAMDNLKFIEERLDPREEITLVDFDPWGSPGPTMQSFFEKYPVKRKMIVCMTDSYDVRGWHGGSYDWWKHWRYRPTIVPEVKDIPRIHDSFMEKIGRRHGFRPELINRVWKKGSKTIYSSYLLTPN